MERITLNAIRKKENKIEYDCSVSDGFIKYFSGRKFIIEYPENIEKVPDGIAAIPFVCNVLPLVWLSDALLEVPELDYAFYECIPQFKEGYCAMFPESSGSCSTKEERSNLRRPMLLRRALWPFPARASIRAVWRPT